MCVYQAGREWRRDGGRIERERDRDRDRGRGRGGGGDRKREPNSICFTWIMG